MGDDNEGKLRALSALIDSALPLLAGVRACVRACAAYIHACVRAPAIDKMAPNDCSVQSLE